MTREEAIKVINNHFKHWRRLLKGGVCDETEGMETIVAFKMAIEALEQEPILDKIRAEIVRALSEEMLDVNGQLLSDVGVGLAIALSIIDNYKAESEE